MILALYKDFSLWMEQKKDYKVSNISAHWKRIKVVMRAAEDKKLSTSRVYEKFKKESYTTDNIALSDPELQKLEKVKLQDKELAAIRDHFLLACYTGARISDWGRLRKEDIVNGIWKYTAHKTIEVCRVRISPKVIAILDKYNDNLPELPKSDQVVNENIRAICQMAKIDSSYTQNVIKGGKLVTDTKPRYKLVTSHTGRRTFATRLILQGVPVHLVMAQTGHKTLSSFESYIKLKELQTDQALQDLNVFV
jgi:integrase